MEGNRFKFQLNHFLLMSKGWYACSDSRDDLITLCKRVLKELDGYALCGNVSSIIRIVLSQYDKWNDWAKEHGLGYDTISDFYRKVEDYRTLYEVSFEEAIIIHVKSTFSMISSEYLDITIKPKYDRKLYKRGLKFNFMFSSKRKQGMTYSEQNSIVNKIFKK